MPHGPHPRDAADFSQEALQHLRKAAADLRLLLDRGYGMRASLKLVGNHFRLTKRQRQFLYRAVSPPRHAEKRRRKLLAASDLTGKTVAVDGYNCLIITECCLAGGIVLQSDDGVLRDIQGVFGSYRISPRTVESIHCLTHVLAAAQPASVSIVLDERMRYASKVAETWEAAVAEVLSESGIDSVESADRSLRAQPPGTVVATSDRRNMDAASAIVDLPRAVADRNAQSCYIKFWRDSETQH